MKKRKKRMKLYYTLALLVTIAGGIAAVGLYLWQGPSSGTGESSGTSEVVQGTEPASEASGTEVAEGTEEPETETEDPGPEVVEITISAVGDLTFGRNQKSSYDGTFDEYYDTYGADYFFQNVKSIFEQDDCTIGNLECTLTESTDRREKTWNLKGRQEYAEILPANSIDIVGLGNNHIMDYNQEGVDDTFAALENVGLKIFRR
jgi:poly-gamma-glutamate synthesis protein (capsule biosynthesis protein)